VTTHGPADPAGRRRRRPSDPFDRSDPQVPESKAPRKKATYTPPPASKAKKPNPPWFVPLMLGLMLLGLAWIVVTYLSSWNYPIPGISAGNLAIGFGLIMAGFVMTTRWR
jgi:hypothetical protein